MADEKNGHAIAGSPANNEVINILAKYLAEAKAGKYVAIGIVVVADSDAVATEYGGAAGTEFAMNFGIDYLKDQVIAGFIDRMHQNARSLVAGRAPLIMPVR